MYTIKNNKIKYEKKKKKKNCKISPCNLPDLQSIPFNIKMFWKFPITTIVVCTTSTISLQTTRPKIVEASSRQTWWERWAPPWACFYSHDDLFWYIQCRMRTPQHFNNSLKGSKLTLILALLSRSGCWGREREGGVAD